MFAGEEVEATKILLTYFSVSDWLVTKPEFFPATKNHFSGAQQYGQFGRKFSASDFFQCTSHEQFGLNVKTYRFQVIHFSLRRVIHISKSGP